MQTMKTKICIIIALLATPLLLICCKDKGSSSPDEPSIIGTWHNEMMGDTYDETIKTTVNICDDGTMTMDVLSSLDNVPYSTKMLWETVNDTFVYAYFDENIVEYDSVQYKISDNIVTFSEDGMELWKFTKQ